MTSSEMLKWFHTYSLRYHYIWELFCYCMSK